MALDIRKAHYSMEGLGVWARLNTQVMKCLFMVMSLNPALLISTADFTCLRQAQMEMDFVEASYLILEIHIGVETDQSEQIV